MSQGSQLEDVRTEGSQVVKKNVCAYSFCKMNSTSRDFLRGRVMYCKKETTKRYGMSASARCRGTCHGKPQFSIWWMPFHVSTCDACECGIGIRRQQRTFSDVSRSCAWFHPSVPFQKHVASWKTRCVEGFDPARDVLRKTKNTKKEPGTPDLHRFGVLFLASSTVIKDTLGHGHMPKLEGVQVGLSLSNS